MQVKVVRSGAGGADGADFGMGRGVVAGDDAVPAFGDYFAVAHDDGAEGATFAVFAALPGQFDGAGEKLVIRHLGDPS